MTMAETRIAGRYRIGRCLGTGGMGRVWLARDEVLRRDVAIKEIALPFGLSDGERDEMQGRSLREARAAARLNHPNVVRIYDVADGDERPLIVMEYVPSRSLLQVIQENGPLPVDAGRRNRAGRPVRADAANRVGVIHRDVKPSNVLIADDGRVVLTDFGSAHHRRGRGRADPDRHHPGSPRYIAPERARNGVATPGVRPVVAGRDAVRGGRGPRAVRPRDDAGRRWSRWRPRSPTRSAGGPAQAGAERAAAEGSRARMRRPRSRSGCAASLRHRTPPQ